MNDSMSPGQPCLYIVATPIGNLGDMSARALAVLKSVDLIAAEDTRHSARLLQHFGIATRLTSYHDYSTDARVDDLVTTLEQGRSVALISDAGTPLISDPGYRLVVRVREAGIRVVPVPGSSALTAALSVCGLPTDRFVFEGFLPARSTARTARLEALRTEPRTLVYYESPHRILASLEDIAHVFGEDRYVVVCRELTKTFETVHGDRVDALLRWMRADENQQRGEFVLVVKGSDDPGDDSAADALRILRLLLEELPLKQAASLAAKITGEKKNELYQQALAMRDAP